MHHSIRTKRIILSCFWTRAKGYCEKNFKKLERQRSTGSKKKQKTTELTNAKDQAKTPKNIIPDELKGDTETSTMRRQMKEVNSEEGPSANKGEGKSKKTMSYVS